MDFLKTFDKLPHERFSNIEVFGVGGVKATLTEAQKEQGSVVVKLCCRQKGNIQLYISEADTLLMT